MRKKYKYIQYKILTREKKLNEMRNNILNQLKNAFKYLQTRYNIPRILVFGSIIKPEKFRFNSDIDVAIECKDKDFFKIYSYLLDKTCGKIDLKHFKDIPQQMKEKILKESICFSNELKK